MDYSAEIGRALEEAPLFFVEPDSEPPPKIDPASEIVVPGLEDLLELQGQLIEARGMYDYLDFFSSQLKHEAQHAEALAMMGIGSVLGISFDWSKPARGEDYKWLGFQHFCRPTSGVTDLQALSARIYTRKNQALVMLFRLVGILRKRLGGSSKTIYLMILCPCRFGISRRFASYFSSSNL